MMNKYSPRRASKRWLEGAPDYVMDILDNPKFADRYTVIFGRRFAIWLDDKSNIQPGFGEYRNTYLAYLSLSEKPSHPQGVSMWGEMSAYDVANYRRVSAHRRIRWLDLPENVRAHVIARCEDD